MLLLGRLQHPVPAGSQQQHGHKGQKREAQSRHADGEPRFKVVAQVEGGLFVAVCTMRGAACRVISLRRANAAEERIYGERPLQA